MPDTQDTPTGNNIDRILTGQSDWVRWFPSFKAYARADDTWTLFDGSESILLKPTRPTRTIPTDDAATARTSRSTSVATEGTASTDLARRDFEYQQDIEWYKMDLHEYEKQHERIRRANKALHDRIDPSMRSDVENCPSPKAALDHLQSLYKMQDSRAVQYTRDQIDSLTLLAYKSMTDYLNKMRQLKTDLAELDGKLTDSQFINKIMNGLPATYGSWIERYHDNMADPAVAKPDLKSIEAQLLSKEMSLPAISKLNIGGGR